MRILCLWLCLQSAGLAAVEAVAMPGAPAAVSPAAKGPKLAGRWGIGFDSIPGASAGTGLIPGLAAPNALAVRYWVKEGFSWDGLVAVNLNSQRIALKALL